MECPYLSPDVKAKARRIVISRTSSNERKEQSLIKLLGPPPRVFASGISGGGGHTWLSIMKKCFGYISPSAVLPNNSRSSTAPLMYKADVDYAPYVKSALDYMGDTADVITAAVTEYLQTNAEELGLSYIPRFAHYNYEMPPLIIKISHKYIYVLLKSIDQIYKTKITHIPIASLKLPIPIMAKFIDKRVIVSKSKESDSKHKRKLKIIVRTPDEFYDYCNDDSLSITFSLYKTGDVIPESFQACLTTYVDVDDRPTIYKIEKATVVVAMAVIYIKTKSIYIIYTCNDITLTSKLVYMDGTEYKTTCNSIYAAAIGIKLANELYRADNSNHFMNTENPAFFIDTVRTIFKTYSRVAYTPILLNNILINYIKNQQFFSAVTQLTMQHKLFTTLNKKTDPKYKIWCLYSSVAIYTAYGYLDYGGNINKQAFKEFCRKINTLTHQLHDDIMANSNDQLKYISDTYSLILKGYLSENNRGKSSNVSNYLRMQMYTYYLGISDSVPVDERIKKAFIMGAGPVLLKIVQKYASKPNIRKEFKDIFKMTYENNPAMSSDEFGMVSDVIYKSHELTHIDQPALSVASISDVYFGYVKPLNAPTKSHDRVVVKIIKPRSIFGISLEYKQYLNASENIQKTDKTTYDDAAKYGVYLFASILEEFDFKHEIKNIVKSREIYDKPDRKISVIEGYGTVDTEIPALVMTIAKDKSLNELIKTNKTGVCKSIIPVFKQFLLLWVSASLLNQDKGGGGYAHTDLHPGNIMVDTVSGALTLIDFGNFLKIPAAVQHYLLNILKIQCIICKTNDKKAIRNLIGNIENLCDIKTDSKTFTSVVEFFKPENKKRECLGELINHIITRIPTVGECAKGAVPEFAKGVDLLEKTWISLCKCANISYKPLTYVVISQLKLYDRYKFLTTTNGTKAPKAVKPIDAIPVVHKPFYYVGSLREEVIADFLEKYGDQLRNPSFDPVYKLIFESLVKNDININDSLRGKNLGNFNIDANAIYNASRDGLTTIVEMLIRLGADVNHNPDTHGSYPLAIAAWNGHLDVVKLLLENGANPSGYTSTYNDDTPGLTRNLLYTPLLLAAHRGHLDIVKYLIAHNVPGAFDKYVKNAGDRHPVNTVYVESIIMGHLPIFKYIFKKYTADINMHVPIHRFYIDDAYSSTKETYDTVLSLACEFNRSEFVDYILKKGADVNKPNRSTMTPIMVNSRQGNIKIFNVLLGHGANVYSKTGKDPSPLVYHEERSPIHRTALMFASQFGHDMIVKKLLTLLDIDSINEKDSGDLSALMTAVDHKHSKVVKLLLPKIKNVNEIKTCLGKAYNNRDGPTQKVLTAFLSALSVSSSSSSHAKP